MKHFTLFLLAMVLTIAGFSNANDTLRIREIGLTGAGISSSLGLTYRFGKPHSLWRISGFNFGGNQFREAGEEWEGEMVSVNTRFGSGLSFGKEYRSIKSSKIELRYGIDARLTFQFNHSSRELEAFPGNNRESRSLQFTPGIGGVLGMNYLLNEQFLIGGEVLPVMGYTFGREITIRENADGTEPTEEHVNLSGFNFNFNTSQVRLSFIYRFTK